MFDLYQCGRRPAVEGPTMKEVDELKTKLGDAEVRSKRCLRSLQSMTRDYQELIGITAELIDSLEATVRGDRISPEFLRDVCQRLFDTQGIEVEDSVDFSRPGTRAEQLRASVVLSAEEHREQLRRIEEIDNGGRIADASLKKVEAMFGRTVISNFLLV